MKPVVIVGNAPMEYSPYDKDVEIWGMNVGAMEKPRVDLVVDIHTTEYLKRTGTKEYLDWLVSLSVPLYMREQTVWNASLYPFEMAYALTENVKHNGEALKFFTNGTPYLIALAILMDKPKIIVCGVEMVMMRDFRESFCFWVGIAGGRGIELDIIGANDIFSKPLYGESGTA